MKIRLWTVVSLLFLGSLAGNAQYVPPVNENFVYQDNLRSVNFHIEGLYLSYPIIDLNSDSRLVFSFDDMDADVKDYVYTITHCDINWEPTGWSEMEYIDGYAEERIDNFNFSFNTVTPFTHYQVTLPNRSMRWTKSGNYLLRVYEDEGDRQLVITRRFVVVDRKVDIIPQLVRPAAVSQTRTHQEIDFVVNHEYFDIRSPQVEIRAVVLQNGRWDNAITDLTPIFTRPNRLVFDYQNKITFPAGKEFRWVDLRSFRFYGQRIIQLDRYPDGYEVLLDKDYKRFDQVYLYREDINGQFIIENQDNNGDPDLISDYADVLFRLYSPEPYYDHKVYFVSELTDWQLRPKYEMVYNPAENGYVIKLPLKQGYHEYAYATVPMGSTGRTVDLSEIEGNWHETENEYTILIYYHAFGDRYDQVIGAVTINSAP